MQASSLRDPPWGSRVGPSRHSAPDLAGPAPWCSLSTAGQRLGPCGPCPPPPPRGLPSSRGPLPGLSAPLESGWPSCHHWGQSPALCPPRLWAPGSRQRVRQALFMEEPVGEAGGRQAGGAASVEASRGRFLKGGGSAAQAKAWPHVSPRERAAGGPWSPLRGAGGRCTLRKPPPIHPGPRWPSELMTTPMARPRRTSLVWGAGAGSGGGEPSWGTPRSHSAPLAASQADLA